MNLTRYSFIIEISKRILQFIAAAFIMIPIIYYFTKDLSLIRYTYFLFPVPCVLFLINRYCKKLYLYLPLLLCLFTAVLLPVLHKPVIMPITFSVFLLVSAILNFANSLHAFEELKRNISPVSLLFPLLSLFFIYSQSMTILLHSMFILFFLALILYLINHYIIHLTQYFKNNSDVSGIPYNQIKSSNHLLIGVFMVLCILIMILFIFVPLKSILTAAGSLLLLALRAFFGLFSHEPVAEPEMTTTEDNSGSGYADFFAAQDPETSLLMQVLEKIFMAVGVVCIIAAAVALIIYLLLLFYRYFYGRNQDTRDTAAFLSPFDKRETVTGRMQDSTSFRHKRFPIFKSKSEKIRYLFYQAILSKHKEFVPQTMTAYELLYYKEESHSILKTELEKLPEEKAEALTRLYNKARYGNESCTAADVNNARTLIREFVNMQ